MDPVLYISCLMEKKSTVIRINKVIITLRLTPLLPFAYNER